MDTKRLEAIGRQLKAANRRRALIIESAQQAAREAISDGLTEAEIARALGVDRARTLRRWLGK